MRMQRLILLVFGIGCIGIFILINQEPTADSEQVLDTQQTMPAEVFFFGIPKVFSEPLVLATDQHSVTINPVGAQDAAKQELEENVVKYVGAYTNVDVVQTQGENYIKEEIILREPGHPSSFTYQIDVTDLTWDIDDGGNILFYQTDSSLKAQDLRRLFTIPAPFMIDADGIESHTQEVEVKLFDDGRLILYPNQDWLDSHPYPIIIDPSIEINILNTYSHPRLGDDWIVSFTTKGQGDLRIVPVDEDTILDDVFMSLKCDGKKVDAQELKGDIIFYPDWQCDGVGEVRHFTKKQGKHTLRFEFSGHTSLAYNDSWWNYDWDRRFKYTIANADLPDGESLDGFPLQIDLENDAPAAFWTNVDTDGDEIRVVSCEDSVNLPAHLEMWDSVADEGIIWVRTNIDQDTGSNTDCVYVYYDNSGASAYWDEEGTYDDDYVAVYHLDESSCSGVDSTSNNHDSTACSLRTPYQQDQNMAGYCHLWEYGGASPRDYISVPNDNDWSEDDLTVLILVNFVALAGDRSGGYYQLQVGKATVGSPWWEWLMYQDDSGSNEDIKWQIRNTGGSQWLDITATNAVPSTGTWYHLVGTVDDSATDSELFKDGSSIATDTTSSGTRTGNGANPFHIGGAAGSLWSDSYITEVRVSKIVRSDEWIEFAAKSDKGNGGTAGSEETAPSPPSLETTIRNATIRNATIR